MDQTNSFSVLNFSADEICGRASRMGVSLGPSDICKSASVKLIRDTEMQRSLTLLKKAESLVEADILAPHNLVVSNISTLCEDLNDVEDVEDSRGVQEIVVSVPPRGRNKKIYDSSTVRRSKRIKIQKNKNSKNARS
jgi:hypothetical protein